MSISQTPFDWCLVREAFVKGDWYSLWCEEL